MSTQWQILDIKPIKSVNEILEETKEPLVKQVKTSKPKRDENGRLLKGYTANPNGRPKKFTLYDYITENEVKELVKLAKMHALKGKSDLMKFLLEQIFGKARQSLQVENNLTLEDLMQRNWELRREALEKMSDEEFINSFQNKV